MLDCLRILSPGFRTLLYYFRSLEKKLARVNIEIQASRYITSAHMYFTIGGIHAAHCPSIIMRSWVSREHLYVNFPAPNQGVTEVKVAATLYGGPPASRLQRQPSVDRLRGTPARIVRNIILTEPILTGRLGRAGSPRCPTIVERTGVCGHKV